MFHTYWDLFCLTFPSVHSLSTANTLVVFSDASKRTKTKTKTRFPDCPPLVMPSDARSAPVALVVHSHRPTNHLWLHHTNSFTLARGIKPPKKPILHPCASVPWYQCMPILDCKDERLSWGMPMVHTVLNLLDFRLWMLDSRL